MRKYPKFKLIILTICMLLSCVGLSAQQIKFSPKKWDFGAIAEDGGKVSHTFEFKNMASKPIVILGVHTSCGCTSTNYTKKPIASGEVSTLEVTFDPMYRPGTFTKSVSVMTSLDADPAIITILGDVTPRKLTIDERFPFDMGEGLRTAANYFAMSSIEQGEVKQTQLSVINNSATPIYIEIKPTVDSGFLKIDYPEKIEANTEAIFRFSYDLSEAKNYYGTLSDKLDIYVNGHRAQYQLLFSGYVIDNFTNEERNYAPSANIDKRIIKFAALNKDKLSHKQRFEVENTGVSPLKIRRIEHPDEIEVKLVGAGEAEPGESIVFEVRANTSMIDYGTFSRYVTLTFNDPDRPMQRIRVTGIVVE